MGNAGGNLKVVELEQYKASQSTWDKIAESKEFQGLMATKRIFYRAGIHLFRALLVCLALS